MTMAPTKTNSDLSLNDLRVQIRGRLYVAGDPGYDKARTTWNLAFDQHPAIVVVAHSVSDVCAAVRYAHKAGLGVAAQSSGHGISLPANDAMLIITREMNWIDIDPKAQTAWVEAGAKWAGVLEKAQAVGLAPLLGSTPDTGVVGYTLGGGMGWLVRKYGLSLDSVRSIELVTAEGRLMRASRDENSDLFWALRGGGGSFGVITGMEIQLYPVTTVFGGNLIYPASMAKEVFLRYREWIASMPEEFTTSVVLMHFPDDECLPDNLRGQLTVMVRGCYCGPTEKGQALLQPWLDWQAPLQNFFYEMPFTEVGIISNDPLDPVSAFVSGGEWLRELSDEAIDLILRYGVTNGVTNEGTSPFLFIEVRHVGGAKSRVDDNDAAFSHRAGSLMLEIVSVTPTPDAYEAMAAYTRHFKTELRPHLTGGVYMNFLEGEERWQRTKDAYSAAKYHRLVSIKTRYDPDNVFRFGYNIPTEG